MGQLVLVQTGETGSNPHTPDYLVIGRIARAHGIRGQVLMTLHTDFPERLLHTEILFIGDAALPVGVASVRLRDRHAIVGLVGVETRNDAETLRGQWVKIPAAEAAGLPEDEYFVYQIVGLQVVTQDGRRLGQVRDVLFTGANDVYVVQGPEGEVLVPAIADVVLSVDLDARRMTVKLPEGL